MEIDQKPYQKEFEATIAGIILAIGLFFLAHYMLFGESNNTETTSIALLLGWLIVMPLIVWWVIRISNRQNRNSTVWGLCAFIAPAPTLIIIGLLPKRNIIRGTYESPNQSEPPNEQRNKGVFTSAWEGGQLSCPACRTNIPSSSNDCPGCGLGVR